MAVMTGKRTPTGRHLTVVPDVPATPPGGASEGDSAPPPAPPTGPSTRPDSVAAPGAETVVHALFGVESNTRSTDLSEPLTGDTEFTAQGGTPFTPEMTASEVYQVVADSGAPPELLAMIEGFGDDVEALIAWLGEMGMGESPQETLNGILAGWQPLLKRGAGALEAELSGAEFLRMFEVTVGDPDSADPLSQLITDAASTGAPEALAMARVLQLLGPLPVRRAATAAATRLAAAGVKDMPWARTLGTPEWVSAFGFADPLGTQQSLAVEFRYGKRSHACVLLIDHDLGGGVKDCWFTDEVPRIRAQFWVAAAEVTNGLTEYTAGQAAAMLREALAAPECPADADQVEDVGTYLRLVRSRSHRLPAPLAPGSSGPEPVTTAMSRRRPPAGSVVSPTGRSSRGASATIHRIKVSLAGAKPPIWRRLELASTTTLADLHHIVQACFEWNGSHLWLFDTPQGRYGPGEMSAVDADLEYRDARRLTLERAAPAPGSKITYLYDFGDDWQHVIQVEAIRPALDGTTYPRCTGGRRAAPPEDCGGVWGYADLIETLGDTDHPGHEAMLEWLGLGSPADFDPGRFAAAEINDALSPFADHV
jgi:Plasmid pRiA4b ORF-3-like protein